MFNRIKEFIAIRQIDHFDYERERKNQDPKSELTLLRVVNANRLDWQNNSEKKKIGTPILWLVGGNQVQEQQENEKVMAHLLCAGCPMTV